MALAVAPVAFAQALQKNQPIEISSDKLDVLQPEHKAIFSGNVIAIQGTTNMRAAQMTVFYRDSGSTAAPGDATPAPAPAGAAVQGIYRIESIGNVVFTTPTETAIGDTAIYNVDTDTIDLVGSNVTLTRGQNILKGTKLNYNMGTGRSILTAGSGTTDVTGMGGKPARVHGLFVPKADKAKPAEAKPSVKP
ncbi:MAG: LptA/OstA family protein [Rickettsiales bacterium]